MSKKEKKKEKKEDLLQEEGIVQVVAENAIDKIEQAIIDLKKDPNVINEIITERREVNNKTCKNARVLSEARIEMLNTSRSNFTKARNIGSNFSKEIELIDQIIAEQYKIQNFIDSTTKNLSNYVSNKSDKTIDKANSENKLMSMIYDSSSRSIVTSITEWDVVVPETVPTEEQLKNELKRTKETRKIWEGLSKTQGDDDRSKGYAELSDNLASMAMSGINTGRQGMALVQALLTYAVVDVLYEGLLQGAGKGLIGGATRGYIRANKGIKSAANAIYQIKKGADKQLKQQIATQIVNIKDSIIDETTENRALTIALDNLNQTKDVSKRVNQFIEAINTFNTGKLDALYSDQINEVNRVVAMRKDIINSNPNLATKGVAVLGGIVGGVVVGITNAIWEGVKNPAKALTKDAPNLLKQQYNNIKPQQGTSWNKDRAQVKEELQTKRKAKSMIGYAKKTDTEGKFTQMVDKQKEAAKQANGKGANGI